ncbi:MAG: lamin tail domain-containing protein [Planctomycetes bacterium]|nr:lamin tail domain-containing protein [Planctomycetota bacterium]
MDRFDTLVFDARMNYAWTYGGGVSPTTQRLRAQYTRDQYVANLHIAMGSQSPHGRHVHLYINGLYWGLYNIHERPDAAFAAEHLGGDKADYDVLKHGNQDGDVVGMDDDPAGRAIAVANYSDLFTAAGQDLTNPANYHALLDVLDIDEFIDYMLANFHAGNTDWAHHNWYATFNRVAPDGKWRYHSWDPEKCLQNPTSVNVTTKNNAGGPTRIHQLLKSSPEYRLLFADHVHKHFFNNGVLATTGATALYQKLLDEVDRAVVGESARWGDSHLPDTDHSNSESTRTEPFRREVEWVAERDRLLSSWFPVRSATVLGQLGTSLYPSTLPPVFNQHGGSVATGFSLMMTNPNGGGTIYYTLDGGDPRLPGGGESVSSSAGGSIIWVSDNKTGGADQAWIELIKAETSYTVDETSFRNAEGRTLDSTKIATLNAANLIIVSRDINSGSYDDGSEPTDWNSITTPIILQSAHLARNSKWLWFDTTLIGGATPDMEAVVPAHAIFAGITLDMNDEVDIIDEAVGNVSSMEGGNAGTGKLIARRADTGKPWIVYWEADETNMTEYYSGAGSSGIPKGNRLFFAGGTSSGNDGRENFNADGEQMFINAVNFMFTPIDPSFNFPPTVDAGDGQAVLWPGVSALMDATVSDDGKPAVPGTVTLTWSLQSGPVGVTFGDLGFSPNEFVEDPNVTFPEVGVYVLKLEAFDGEKTSDDTVTVKILGDNVLIYTGPITLTKSVQVKARVLEGGTWSALNEATFGVGPVADSLRVTEIMYHPADAPIGDPNAEYIELQNVGDQPIKLNLVRFANGIDFTFGDLTLNPNAYVVVVHNQAAFDNEYPLFNGVIAGEFPDSRLDNGGERLRLEDALGKTIQDFSYKDSWRSITDGEGFSLTIIEPAPGGQNVSALNQEVYWKLDASAGTNAADSSGNNRDGTLKNGPTWQPAGGINDGALLFDGVNDYVEIDSPAYQGVTGSASRTVSAWIKTSFAGNQHIISWGTAETGKMWLLMIDSNNNHALRMVVFGGTVIGSTPIADGAWHHVAAVLNDDGSADVSEVQLYVDGNLETISSVTAQPIDTSSVANVRIGTLADGSPHFNGLIDDVRIYSRALNQTELGKLGGGWSQREAWRASAYLKGSPGTDDSGIIPNPGAIVINEVLAHSDTIVYDFIELYNTTASDIDLDGWFLSDEDTDAVKYEIKTGDTVILAGQYKVFYENLHFGVPGDAGVNTAFALSENGEKVVLRSSQGGELTGYRSAEAFGANSPDIALGRYLKSTNTFNFVAMSSNTPNAANAYPKVGPVVISEIMYHPSGDGDAEFIELVNISDSPITLYDAGKLTGWQMTDGVTYTFGSVTLNPNEVMLLVKDMAVFNAAYPSTPPGVQKVLWTAGSLDNGGERIQIGLPGDLDGAGILQFIRIDRVTYDDKAPWSTEADGLGKSLTRKVLSDYGNDPANWQGSAPSPGL